MKKICEYTLFHEHLLAGIVDKHLVPLNKRSAVTKDSYGIMFGYRGVPSGSKLDFVIERKLLKVIGWYPNGGNIWSFRPRKNQVMVISILEKRGHETGRKRTRIVVRRERKGDRARHLKAAYLTSGKFYSAKRDSVLLALRDSRGIALWQGSFVLMPDILNHNPADIVEWHLKKFFPHLEPYRKELFQEAATSVIPVIKSMRRAWTLAEANRAACKFLRKFSSRHGFKLDTNGGKTRWKKM